MDMAYTEGLTICPTIFSRRQKFLSSPTTRSLNPFPSVTQLNMKELLVSLSESPTSNPHGPPPNSGGLAVSTANITSNPV